MEEKSDGIFLVKSGSSPKLGFPRKKTQPESVIIWQQYQEEYVREERLLPRDPGPWIHTCKATSASSVWLY